MVGNFKIETVTMPGKGRMQITGKLGDVMQESVKAAKSFVRSKCLEYGIIPPLFERKIFIFTYLKERHQKMDHLQELEW
jgi:ATP-dependent Lon protease